MPTVALPSQPDAPATHTLGPGPPLLFTSATWVQSLRGSGVTVQPAVLVYDQSGALVGRFLGPAVTSP